MNKMYLTKDELEAILDFMNQYALERIELEQAGGNGIGSILKARRSIFSAETSITTTIEKIISDESTW